MSSEAASVLDEIAERERQVRESTGSETLAPPGFACPECMAEGKERVFETKQGLGRHRTTAHGVTSSRARSKQVARRPRSRPARQVEPKPAENPYDSEALLRALFPGGSVPVMMMGRVMAWLAEAEAIHATLRES